MVAVRQPDVLITDLERLVSSLEDLDLRVAGYRGIEIESDRDRLVRTIRSYLIPRLTEPDRPLTVVFAGPTGSGKSTLINSVSGLDVAVTGPLRPTTSKPMVLTSPKWSERAERLGGVHSEVATASAPILDHMAFVDTPDIDSNVSGHRVVAETMIDNADVVVFVTSALRYADLVPWEVLRRAVSRGAPVVNVINRVTADSSGAVVDFRHRLSEAGVGGDLIRVPEHHIVGSDTSVPAMAVRDLRRRLMGLVAEHNAAKSALVNRVLASTVEEARALASSLDQDLSWVGDLESRIGSELLIRFDDLDLASMVGEVATTGEVPSTRWSRRRWLRRHGVSDAELNSYLMEIKTGLTAATVSDIRSRIVDLHLLRLVDSDLDDLARDTSDLVRVVIDEWLSGIERLVGFVARRDRNLATQTLVASALGGGDRVAGIVLFGLRRDVLIDETRESLTSGLQIVYALVSRRIARQVRRRLGRPSGDDLRERATTALVTSHFSDA